MRRTPPPQPPFADEDPVEPVRAAAPRTRLKGSGTRFTAPLLTLGVTFIAVFITLRPQLATPRAAGDQGATPGPSATSPSYPSDSSLAADSATPVESTGSSAVPTEPTELATPADTPGASRKPAATPYDPFKPSKGPVEGPYANLDMVISGQAPGRVSWITPAGTYSCIWNECFWNIKPGTSGTFHWTIPSGETCGLAVISYSSPYYGLAIPGGCVDFAFTMPTTDTGLDSDFEWASPSLTPPPTPTPTPTDAAPSGSPSPSG